MQDSHSIGQFRTYQFFLRNVFVCDRFHNLRSGDEHVRCVANLGNTHSQKNE
jgi:hypothetical protein